MTMTLNKVGARGALLGLVAVLAGGCSSPKETGAPAPAHLRVTAIPDANKDTLREDQQKIVELAPGQDRVCGWSSCRSRTTRPR